MNILKFTGPQRELVKNLSKTKTIEETWEEFHKIYKWFSSKKAFLEEVDNMLGTTFSKEYKRTSNGGRKSSRVKPENFEEVIERYNSGEITVAQASNELGIQTTSFYYFKEKWSTQKPEIEVEPIKEENIEIEEVEEPIKEIEKKEDYKPTIEEEVNNNLNKKYRSLNSYLDKEREYNLEDYINILDMLVYLSKNKEEIIQKSINQSDIIEAYRRDIEHGIELEKTKDYDNLDRLHYLGTKRRLAKWRAEDLHILSPYLELVNVPKTEEMLKTLRAKQNERKNSKYIPRVDSGMVSRYKWCTSGSLYSKVNNTPIVSTTLPANTRKKVYPFYRVQAEFLVWEGEPFHIEYIDVQANSPLQAQEMAEKHFNKMKRDKSGILYSIKDIYQLP